jgi:peptidoglycan/xylan/chitin deacetylase (PgdA/CDA1 family)
MTAAVQHAGSGAAAAPGSTAIPILMYHQIDATPPRGAAMRGLVVSPTRFSAHMRLLAWLGWRGVSMSELLPYLNGTRRGRVFGITFDDGFVNNLDHAAPVLHALGFSATCYAVSDLVGRTNEWDSANGVTPAPLMSGAQMRHWLAMGMEIGSHTRSHCRLGQLGDPQARDEITGSRHALQDLTGASVDHFCYPYGDYRAEQAAWVAEAGYASATTTRRGRATTQDSNFELPRVLMARATHALHLLLKMHTQYEDKRGTGA